MENVFVSYSHSDSDFADRLVDDLRASEVPATYDKLLLRVGDSIIETVVPNLVLIPSSIDLTGAELELVNVAGREFLDAERLAEGVDLSEYGLQASDLTELKRLFDHATTFGSAADNDGMPNQLGVIALFDRRIKGVHVNVEDHSRIFQEACKVGGIFSRSGQKYMLPLRRILNHQCWITPRPKLQPDHDIGKSHHWLW